MTDPKEREDRAFYTLRGRCEWLLKQCRAAASERDNEMLSLCGDALEAALALPDPLQVPAMTDTLRERCENANPGEGPAYRRHADELEAALAMGAETSETRNVEPPSSSVGPRPPDMTREG